VIQRKLSRREPLAAVLARIAIAKEDVSVREHMPPDWYLPIFAQSDNRGQLEITMHHTIMTLFYPCSAFHEKAERTLGVANVNRLVTGIQY
jgi:hypothetical protein